MCAILASRMRESSQRVRWAKGVGVYPYFRVAEGVAGPRVRYDAREVLMFGSNDYLGLASDPRVREEAIDAIRRLGTGPGGGAGLRRVAPRRRRA